MKKNILLVEYSTPAIETIQKILHDKVFEFSIARSEETAKDLLKHFTFDLVITETLLPKSHGFILSKFVADNYPSTKIIIISDRLKQADYKHEALKLHGASDFFEKPLPEKEFRKRVLEILKLSEEDLREMNWLADMTTKMHILPTLEELEAARNKNEKKNPPPPSPEKSGETDDTVFEIDLD